MIRIIAFIDQYLDLSKTKVFFGFYIPIGLLIVLSLALLPAPIDEIVGMILSLLVIACLIAQGVRDYWLTIKKLFNGKGPQR